MIDAALIDLLDGPTPAVLTPLGAPERWEKHGLVTSRFDHTGGTLLTLTPEGESAAKTTLALKHALRRHPELLEALTNPAYGSRDPGAGHSIPRAQEHKRRAA